MRVYYRVRKLRRIVNVDTQKMRNKLCNELEEVFQIASDYARGDIERVTDEAGKVRPLSMAEETIWAFMLLFFSFLNNAWATVDLPLPGRPVTQTHQPFLIAMS